MNLLQKINCRFGEPPLRFGHKPIKVIATMQPTGSQIIQCTSCKRLFGINHNVELILPLDNEMIEMYEMFGNDMTIIKEIKDDN